MYLGRIITKSKTIVGNELIDVTNDAASIDSKIPTLIVGKKLAEEIFGKEKIKVLNKSIAKNISWTFAKTEKRSEFEKGIEQFTLSIFKKITNAVKYYYVDVMTLKPSKLFSFLRLINDETKKTLYMTNSHIYLYCNKWVFGISLNDVEYMGISKNRLLSYLHRIPQIEFMNNQIRLSNDLKSIVKNNNIIIPYVYFLIKE